MDKITISMIDKMKHCIGYDTACSKGLVTGIKHRKYDAFRNYYTTSDDNPELDYLVSLNLMTKQSHRGCGKNAQAYFVSIKGFEFLRGLLGVKITDNV